MGDGPADLALSTAEGVGGFSFPTLAVFIGIQYHVLFGDGNWHA